MEPGGGIHEYSKIPGQELLGWNSGIFMRSGGRGDSGLGIQEKSRTPREDCGDRNSGIF